MPSVGMAFCKTGLDKFQFACYTIHMTKTNQATENGVAYFHPLPTASGSVLVQPANYNVDKAFYLNASLGAAAPDYDTFARAFVAKMEALQANAATSPYKAEAFMIFEAELRQARVVIAKAEGGK